MKKILIIEDEKPLSRALELKLTHLGFSVKTAHDGEEALKLIVAEPFDLMLLDLVMPKVDGFSVLKRMKEKNISTPVIITSNLSQDEDKKRALELGAKEFFIKSNTSLSEIVKKVQQFFK